MLYEKETTHNHLFQDSPYFEIFDTIFEMFDSGEKLPLVSFLSSL
jgi:hypothetical protein